MGAVLIPSFNRCFRKKYVRKTHIYRVLESYPESCCLCWDKIPVDKRQSYIDFNFLHPGRGLLLLKVKGWMSDTAQIVDHTTITLLTPDRLNG